MTPPIPTQMTPTKSTIGAQEDSVGNYNGDDANNGVSSSTDGVAPVMSANTTADATPLPTRLVSSSSSIPKQDDRKGDQGTTIAASTTAVADDNDESKSNDDDNNNNNNIIISPIQATSLLVSFWRWKESQQQGEHEQDDDCSSSILSSEDGRVDGILLQALLTPIQRQVLEEDHLIPKGMDALALRTRFIDDWLMTKNRLENNTFTSTTTTTIANLGAGMDARPYRLEGLSTPNTDMMVYVELDSQQWMLQLKHDVLQKKEKLKPYCHVIQVGADLAQPDEALLKLQEAVPEIFTTTTNDGKPNVDWIAEGLLAYLEPYQHEPLLQMTHDASGPQSRMVLTLLDPAGAANFESMGLKIPWKQLVPLEETLAKARRVGWTNTTVIPFTELYQTYCPHRILHRNQRHHRPIHDLTGYVLVTLEK